MSVTSSEWSYWYPRVYGYFFKRVNAQYEVEELTSQTLTTVFLAKNVSNFQAYTWKVAHNYLVRYINTKNLSPITVSWDESLDLENSTMPKWNMQTEFELQTSQNYEVKMKQLMECISNNISKPEDKQILELAIYEEKNSSQISDITGLKAENVRQRLSRNIKKLRQTCIDLWKHLTTSNHTSNAT